jgi:hypothetical protein
MKRTCCVVVRVGHNITCIEPAAQFNAAFVRLRKMIGRKSSSLVTYEKNGSLVSMFAKLKYVSKLLFSCIALGGAISVRSSFEYINTISPSHFECYVYIWGKVHKI